ncbi:MAG: transglutaminase [Pseudonocardiaceae bacterium]|nr:transglutaminase [Pseudonocardiaceae bacterium]
MTPAPQDFIAPGEFVDSSTPAVARFTRRVLGGVDGPTVDGRAVDPVTSAVRLFEAVRDDIWYDPYSVSADPGHHRASTVATADRTYCIPKAVLLAAAARAAGIPARLGFADVRNHLQTPALRERMNGSELFVFHGYAEMWLRGRWVKATPAFNAELCDRFGVSAMAFDGVHDALLHQYGADGARHMEYVHDRGWYADLPFGEIMRAFREHYADSFIADEAREADLFHDGTA